MREARQTWRPGARTSNYFATSVSMRETCNEYCPSDAEERIRLGRAGAPGALHPNPTDIPPDVAPWRVKVARGIEYVSYGLLVVMGGLLVYKALNQGKQDDRYPRTQPRF